mgnify:CR=1 FL=1
MGLLSRGLGLRINDGRGWVELASGGALVGALSAALTYGPVHAWAGFTPAVSMGLMVAGGLGLLSLGLAHRLVVLQEHAPLDLPPTLRPKCRVVFQSSPSRQTLSKTRAHLRAVMVGHLRDEKWPQTLFEAARLLRTDEGIRIDHIGAALDPALGDAAQATAQACPIIFIGIDTL